MPTRNMLLLTIISFLLIACTPQAKPTALPLADTPLETSPTAIESSPNRTTSPGKKQPPHWLDDSGVGGYPPRLQTHIEA